MNMNDYLKLAAKMDQHMQQLAEKSVTDPNQILDRMMGYVPDLHQIWTGTSDQQLMELSRQFPGFYRYAVIIEEASEVERKKASRFYDNLPKFSEPHQKMMSSLLTDAATLERGYQAMLGSANSLTQAPSLNEMNTLRQSWLADTEYFKVSLITHGTDAKAMEVVGVVLQRLVGRVEQLSSN